MAIPKMISVFNSVSTGKAKKHLRWDIYQVFNEQQQFDFFKVLLHRLRNVNQNRTFSSPKKKILRIIQKSVSACGNNILECFMYRKTTIILCRIRFRSVTDGPHFRLGVLKVLRKISIGYSGPIEQVHTFNN